MSSALLSMAADEAVRAELWISFVSLMRSHLGALQTIGRLNQAVLSETSATSFTVHDFSRSLLLSISIETGNGLYKVERMGQLLNEGHWLLEPESTVRIDAGPAQDMELGVEALAQKLWAPSQFVPFQPERPTA